MGTFENARRTEECAWDLCVHRQSQLALRFNVQTLRLSDEVSTTLTLQHIWHKCVISETLKCPGLSLRDSDLQSMMKDASTCPWPEGEGGEDGKFGCAPIRDSWTAISITQMWRVAQRHIVSWRGRLMTLVVLNRSRRR